MEEARHFLYHVLTTAYLLLLTLKNIYLCMYVFGRVLVVAYESFSCGVGDLVSRRIEPRPPALEAQSWRLDLGKSLTFYFWGNRVAIPFIAFVLQNIV